MSKLKGRIISKTQAEREINKFLDIRERTFDHIGQALKNAGAAPDAVTYFADKEIAFFFDFALLKKLLDETAPNGANGILVFYGAAPDAEASLGIEQGSTTMVIVPSNIQTDASGNIENVTVCIANDDGGGVEYPGGFTSSSLSARVKDLKALVPTRTSNLI